LTDVVKQAESGFQVAKDYWGNVYDAARDDLTFLSDQEGAQWDSRAYASRKRKNKPALQIDRLTQFVNQVSNDIRMNTPSINVIPHSGGADLETAEIFQGIIRDIEQKSSADDAYDYAVNSAIKCSIGFIRVDQRFKDKKGFGQEFFIERVVNPLSVLIDPNSVTPDGSDAMCAWVLDEMPVKDFKDKYPDANPVSFAEASAKELKDTDMIVLCEYFKVKEEAITLALLPDGKVVEFVEGMVAQDTRESTRRTVYHYHLSGDAVLKETTFPSDYIPIVPVYGEEAWRDGKRYIHSLIRKAKDPQKRYNYWASIEAELLMKSPKATIIAVGGTTENYADDYKNPDDAIVLRYDQVDAKGNPAPPPQINPGPPVPVGIVTALQQAAEDIKSTLGLYDAFLGQQSNETSGVAIRQRKMEGDRAVYHYGDNLVRSITQVGRILVTGIPILYRDPQVVSVIGNEEESDNVGINGAMVEKQERSFFLADGQYSVAVKTGASFATMREEAAEFFQQVIQSQPALMQVAGDLMFKYMDFPGAQALSERIKKTIPPQLLETDDEQDPQTAALQQENEQLKQALTAMQGELESKQGDMQIKMQSEMLRAESEKARNEIEVLKLQLQERENMSENQIKQAELDIKIKELQIKEAELQLKEQQMMVDAKVAIAQAKQHPQSSTYLSDTDFSFANGIMPEFDPEPPEPEDKTNEMMMAVLSDLAQSINRMNGNKKIIRNKQGFIEQVVTE
jgi:hypothetical protein